MSTVLWANILVDGAVRSEQQDRQALYRHGDRLDSLCRELGLPSFLGICDTTDMRFNTADTPLPPGVRSTDEVMAAEGVWMETAEAIRVLERLLAHIQAQRIRFGWINDQRATVVSDLSEVIAFAKAHADSAEKFNFSVVM